MAKAKAKKKKTVSKKKKKATKKKKSSSTDPSKAKIAKVKKELGERFDHLFKHTKDVAIDMVLQGDVEESEFEQARTALNHIELMHMKSEGHKPPEHILVGLELLTETLSRIHEHEEGCEEQDKLYAAYREAKEGLAESIYEVYGDFFDLIIAAGILDFTWQYEHKDESAQISFNAQELECWNGTLELKNYEGYSQSSIPCPLRTPEEMKAAEKKELSEAKESEKSSTQSGAVH